MPTYNAASYLKDSIESVLLQTYVDFDFYIYDDCSTDETEKIIRSFTDPRIIYIKNEKNLGIATTLNRGIDELSDKYTYIARMDADDWCYPNRFKKQLDYLEANPKVDLLGTQGYWVKKIKDSPKFNWLYPERHEYIKFYLLFSASFSHQSIIYRCSFLIKNHIKYNETVKTCEDWELWTRLTSIGVLHNLPDFLMKYTIDPNSNHRSNENKKNHFIERCKILANHWKNFGVELSPNEIYHFYYDPAIAIDIDFIENLKKWIKIFNQIFEQAKQNLDPSDLKMFQYLLARRILAYWKAARVSSRLHPQIWLLILRKVKFMNTFKLIKTLLK